MKSPLRYTSESSFTIPFITNLGIKYPFGMLNIGLLHTKPGFEKKVIDDIDSQLEQYRFGLARMEYALENKLSSNRSIYPPHHENGLKSKIKSFEDVNKYSLISRAVHVTLLGRFQVATLFRSYSFGLCQIFSACDTISAVQVIVGGIPVPLCDPSLLSYLKQDNPDEFLTPYAHDDAIYNSLPQHVCDLPILTISQLQINSLANAISAGNLLLPLLFVIDKIIESTAKGNSVNALLIESNGWDDYVIIFRSSNIDIITQCVERIASIKIDDLLKEWKYLSSNNILYPSENKTHDSIAYQYKAFKNGYKKIICEITNNLPNSIKSNIFKHRLFSTSTSISGILWPTIHYPINLARTSPEINRQTNELSSDLNNFNLININGKIKADILIANEAGFNIQTEQILKYFNDHFNDDKNKLSIKEFYMAFGYYDKIINGNYISRQMKNISNYYLDFNFKDFIAFVYFLRWKFLGEPLTNFKRRNIDKIELLPWLGGESQNDTKGISFLRDFSILIQGNILINKSHKKEFADFIKQSSLSSTVSVTEHLSNFISERLKYFCPSLARTNFNGESDPNDIFNLLKSRNISRHLRKAYRQLDRLWISQILDLHNFGYMIELSEFFITWKKALDQCLMIKNNTTSTIQDLIRFFILHFNQSVVQRTLTGFQMSEQSDFTIEFKGGLQKMLTGLDGLTKSVLSLIDSPESVSGLTLIGHGPMPVVDIRKIPNIREIGHEGGEYIFAINKINFIHLVHPIKIASVLHELMHVVTYSNEFKKVLKSAINGRDIIEFMKNPIMDTINGLYEVRILEIFAEYLQGWLLFRDDPDSYAKMFLIQLMLNSETYSHDIYGNKYIIIEHITRCYFVTQLLFYSKGQRFWKKDAEYVLKF